MTDYRPALLLIGLLGATTGRAIELRLDPSTPTPPSLTFDSSQDTRTLTISLHNDGGTPISLAGVQLNLALVGIGDAQGILGLGEINLPVGSFFDGLSQPTIRLIGDATSASVDAFPFGTVIDANATGDLYTITVTGVDSAEGGFRLFANAAMPTNLPASSHWIGLAGPFGIESFTNPVDPATGRLLLGTIMVVQVPEVAAGTLSLLAVTGAHGLCSRDLRWTSRV